MKFFIISDLHGNLDNFLKIQSRIEEANPDLIFILGDMFSNRAKSDFYDDEFIIETLNKYAYKIRAVFGNTDYNEDLLKSAKYSLRNSDSIFLGNKTIYLSHTGYCFSNINLNENDIILSGHTHKIDYQCLNGVFYINPGSCGNSRGFHKESYAILNENSVIFYDLDGKIILSKNM